MMNLLVSEHVVVWSTTSLPLFPGTLELGLEVLDTVQYIGQIKMVIFNNFKRYSCVEIVPIK